MANLDEEIWRPGSASRRMMIHHDCALGDTVHFAHAMCVMRDRGYDIDIAVAPDKAFLFNHLGLYNVTSALYGHIRPVYADPGGREGWTLPPNTPMEVLRDPARYNKAGACMTWFGMFNYGEAWDLINDIEIDLTHKTPVAARDRVARLLRGLPRPIVLLHQKGTYWGRSKDVRNTESTAIYNAILDNIVGTLLLLDCHVDVVPGPTNRDRWLSMRDTLGLTDVPTLTALIAAVDLLVSPDSGPGHLARMTKTPLLGICRDPFHHPAQTYLLNPRAKWIVSGKASRFISNAVRDMYTIIDDDGEGYNAELIGRTVKEMVG